ncbi:MAG: 3,4-dihydroxy 2-butanone 4-phosphate synthase/GTP cyclohydrolase II [Flavobacterium sp.]|jgi:3,4-dihydroxy 2-butanone 4-phosphate synthase/GTP cyclohydrolase II
MPISSTQEILDDFRQGKMVLIMDDEDRENEGDLIIAAEVVTSEHITFMAREACGLICLTLTEKRGKQLNLPLMVEQNNSLHETNFTVSIEAAEGITTGISAADRAVTVRSATKKNAGPSDIVMPGHIFPLIAKNGGVLTRAGHTEAGCDLARLSGYEPASVIVEVMNEDGTMAQRPELEKFAERHGIKLGTIADLIHYRNLNDKTIDLISTKEIETEFGPFTLKTYTDRISDSVHTALIKGEVEEPCLVRVQTINTLRDILSAKRPEFKPSWSAKDSLAYIAEAGAGVLVIVDQYNSQAEILDQIEYFPKTPPVQRASTESASYRVIGIGSQILRDLGVSKMRLLSSPTRFSGISGFNLEVVEFVEKA